MNARLGVILPISKKEGLLSLLPKEMRTWGQEVFAIGDDIYSYSLLSNVEFKAYSLHEFTRSLLSEQMRNANVEYLSIEGAGVNSYEEWLRDHTLNEEVRHPFEKGLLSLLKEIGACALMLVPDNDNLEDVITLDQEGVLALLRQNVHDLSCARGFLITTI